MDAQLAAIYGTGNYEPEETDIEKMAAAELLVKLAEEEGVDLDQFNDQEIAEMVSSLYKEAEFPPKKEEKKHEEGESAAKEKAEEKTEEKVAEADFLGRVMAHSYVQELHEIEKEAAEKMKTEDEDRGSLTGLQKLRQRGRESKAFRAGTHGVMGGAAGAGAGALNAIRQGRGLTGGAIKGGLAGAAIGAGTGALRAMLAKGSRQAHAELSSGEKKKKASADESALEAMAAEVAFNMAKEAGYIDEEGNFLVETQQAEKQASALDTAIYTRALQICEENGIPVEWTE
jgi:hypothetical protein